MAGTCLTSQMIGPGPRFRCLVSLLHFRNAPAALINEANSISSEADALGRQRNRYLHDPMILDHEKKTISRLELTADKKLKHEAVPAETKAIEALIEKIEKLDARFDGLYSRVIAETPPWSRTQYERSRGIRRHLSKPDGSQTAPDSPPLSYPA